MEGFDTDGRHLPPGNRTWHGPRGDQPPEVRNAFRPRTVDELYVTLDHARQSPDVGCVLLTGNGPSPKDGGWAFSSGGDQSVRGASGYELRVRG